MFSWKCIDSVTGPSHRHPDPSRGDHQDQETDQRTLRQAHGPASRDHRCVLYPGLTVSISAKLSTSLSCFPFQIVKSYETLIILQIFLWVLGTYF